MERPLLHYDWESNSCKLCLDMTWSLKNYRTEQSFWTIRKSESERFINVSMVNTDWPGRKTYTCISTCLSGVLHILPYSFTWTTKFFCLGSYTVYYPYGQFVTPSEKNSTKSCAVKYHTVSNRYLWWTVIILDKTFPILIRSSFTGPAVWKNHGLLLTLLLPTVANRTGSPGLWFWLIWIPNIGCWWSSWNE